MHSALVTIAKFSEAMLWVVGFLMFADISAIAIWIYRTGKVDADQGQVITNHGRMTGIDVDPLDGDVAPLNWSVSKQKVLFSRSTFISDESLIRGTATKGQRRFVLGFKLFLFLFWLLFVFLGLSLLPLKPFSGASFIILSTFGFLQAAAVIRSGRQEALRKLEARRMHHSHGTRHEGSSAQPH